MKPNKRVQEPKTSKKFLKPTLAQWNCFNAEYAQTLSQQSLCLSKFVESILRAAENNLEAIPKDKKNNIFQETHGQKLTKETNLGRTERLRKRYDT